MNKETLLNEAIKQEEKFWSNEFKKELHRTKLIKFSSYWWERYYNEIVKYVHKIVDIDNVKILEAGSGSGKASILLGPDANRTLLDISKSALMFAEHLSKKFNAKNIEFIKGNIFNMPFESDRFDFVWNIGVIEHYDEAHALNILREMIRVTKSGGKVAIGVPNFSSGPIIKAKLLRNPYFKFIAGYRLESEHNYKDNLLTSLIVKACELEGKNCSGVCINYFGNPLPMETPKFILKLLGVLLERIFTKNKFLLFVSFEIE